MKNNNTEEKTEYQILGEKLNDRNFAFEFFDNKEIEAKRLLDELLSVTTGYTYNIRTYPSSV